MAGQRIKIRDRLLGLYAEPVDHGTHFDSVDDIHALYHLTEDGIVTIQVRLGCGQI